VYHAVIEDVITNVRDAFLDDGVDEQVLQEMKQIWRNKLLASKAVELSPDSSDGSHPPPIVANNPKVKAPKPLGGYIHAFLIRIITIWTLLNKENFKHSIYIYMFLCCM